MSRIVGIDLGTTNSLVAAIDSGIPLVIADKQGRRLTPSVVHFAAGSRPVVGEPAARARVLKPRETIYSVKRLMGRRARDLAPEERRMNYELGEAPDGCITIPIPGRELTPQEVSAEVLQKLKADAEHYFGETISRAVITVPAYFNDAQRNATKSAGELAGFTVERILNEPTAAALAYGLDKSQEKSRIAVYDLGGGTFDLSILELNQGIFQVLATHGDTRLGGDDLDARVMEFLARKIKDAGGPDFLSFHEDSPPRADALLGSLSRLRECAEHAKISLSSEMEVEINLPFLTERFSFQSRLTRAELEEVTRDIIGRTRSHCLRALADARLETGDLDQVILVGGQTRMPLVRKFVGEVFGCVDFEETRGTLRLGSDYHRPAGPQLNTSQNPDEAVALGAAIQAEILSGGFRNVLLLDVTPLSLGIETFGGLMNVLIPRNSTIPVKAGEMFTTAVDQQRSMLIHVLQGERERARDNWSLGRFTIDFAAAARGVARVGVQFEIDANGILHVLARDTVTGLQKVVEMKSAVDVEDQAVQKMVEESVEHAFSDLAARRWVEARLKAEALVDAAKKGLLDAGAEVSPDGRLRIEDALRGLTEILQNGSETNQADLERLKRACAQVDDATRPLAEILMDKAVEALLRKRGMID